MQKTHLLATALGLALFAGPALAQPTSVPMQAPMSPAGGAVMDPGQTAAGAEMDRTAAMRLVEQAGTALRRGRVAEANELIEQSETRLLTRSTPAPMAGQPMRDPALDSLAAARAALQAHDRSGARQQIDQAMASLRLAGSDAMTGGGMKDATPMQGGGGTAWHGQTMRDGGSAGATMSRADAITDAIILAQAGGGTGSGSSSGGLSGSTPGSPGVGNMGSTPRSGTDSSNAPSQGSPAGGSALPGSSAAGTGAPAPGTTAPQATGTGRSSSGGTITPGSSQGGGGTGSNPTR